MAESLPYLPNTQSATKEQKTMFQKFHDKSFQHNVEPKYWISMETRNSSVYFVLAISGFTCFRWVNKLASHLKYIVIFS